FKVVGGQQVSRLADLPGGPAGALVQLTPQMLKQPGIAGDAWCPDAANPNAYSAELLRVRKVTVTLRVQAALASLRGGYDPYRLPFKNAGTATSANQTLTDQEIKFEVTPRNLNLGR